MELEPPFVLTIDIGTSSCRVLLYDARARRVPGIGERTLYVPRLTPDGGADLDADTLVALVARTIDRALDQIGSRIEQVVTVATSAFWHSLVGVDGFGRAMTPVYLWLDGRSRDAARWLRARLNAAAVHARTGCPLHSTYWPARLVWLALQEPERWRQTRHWLTFADYLTLQLFGRRAISRSMASGTGLLDLRSGEWDASLIAQLPLTRDQLSPIVDDRMLLDGLVPPFARRWPALRSVPWLPGLGDGACANLGAGCETPDCFTITIGTSGAIRAVTSRNELVPPPDLWCYRVDRERFVIGGAFNDGGNLLAWLRQTLRLPPLSGLDRAVASLEPDAHGLTVLPLWGGERSPGWADEARGAIIGLSLRTTPAELYRAALEAIAFRFAAAEASLRAAVGGGHTIVATGGALVRSPVWLQLLADVLGRPVLTLEDDESSSRGAAIVALNVLDQLPERSAAQPAIARTFEPVPAHTERYAQAAARQAALYHLLVRQQDQ